MKRLIHILLICLCVPLASFAQSATEHESVKVYFRQGRSTIDENYLNNKEELDTLKHHLEQGTLDANRGKGSVCITSSVSPEGSNAANDRIVKARAKAISDWVSGFLHTEVGYRIDYVGVDWKSLEELVVASDQVPYKDEVLNIIRNTPEMVTQNGRTVNQRQRALEQLHNGEAYLYLYKNLYPQLRYASAATELWYAPLIALTSPNKLNFACEGGNGTITYTKEEGDEAQPIVSSNSEWVNNISHNQGEINFTVEPNTLAKERVATIAINHYDNFQYVEISQQAAEAEFTFTSPSPTEVDASGGRIAVSFATNTGEDVVPTATCKADWIRNIKTTAKRISFSAMPNHITEPRQAVISVEALGKAYKVVVNQAAATSNHYGDTAATVQLVLDKTETVMVHFRQGSSKLEPNYMNNSNSLKQLTELLEPYVLEQSSDKGKVRISSSASPEGSNAINDRLVKERARAISNWIGKRFNVEVGYIVDAMGIDWDTLITMVEEDDKVPHKEEVLDILYNTPEKVVRNGRTVNERENTLKNLRGGAPYWYIYKNIYPKLRYAAAYTEIWYASELIITTESPIRFTAEGGEGVISFTKNVEDKVVPKTSCSAEWIEQLTADSHTISFRVAQNPVAQSRTSTIFIECYGNVYEVAVEQEGAEPAFLTDAGNTDYLAEGGKGTVRFATNTPEKVVPEASSNSEWISDIVATEDEITYSVVENQVAAPRQDTITVSCFDKTQQIVITQQSAEPELTFITPAERNFDAKGGADTVAFKTNSPEKVVPTATSEAQWITSIVPSDDHIAYEVARNRDTLPRSSVITVSCFDKSKEIVINQAAREKSFEWPEMAVKTNGLYDLLLIPNIGIEFPFAEHFSVVGNWHYSWWKSDRSKWYWRTYGGDLALRYWFGKAAKERHLTGHHVGLYGQIITYDFEMGKKGILAQPWNWSVGVEYGYSLPLAQRINLDMTLGLGYHTGTFEEYLPIDTHYVWQATKVRKYVGPTKFEVSLVWLIGGNNKN